jgi:hypothetical protein
MDLRLLKTARRFGLFEWLIAAISVLTLAAFFRPWRTLLGVFWDISVYERAATDYSHGIDAYRRDVRFPFVYHPLVLRVLARLEAFVSLKVLLPALTLAAVAWLFVELLRAAGKPSAEGQTSGGLGTGVIDPARVALGILAAAGFGGIGVPALMSGNLSPLMHFALMAAFLRGRSAAGTFSRYLPYGLIFLFALVKPYLLIYLAVPVLLYERRVVALTCSAVVVALFALTWQSFRAQWPAEYASFVANLSWHVLGRGDIGYSFFYVFLSLTRKLPLALLLHAVVSLLLIALVPLLFAKKYGRRPPFVPRLMLTYLALTVANPRMKDYDLFPALAGFFTVFGLIAPRAASITLAGILLASTPVIVGFIAPDMVIRHPRALDPFGNWQIIGLALIAVLFVVEMHDQQRAPPRAEPMPAEPSQDPTAAAS